MIDVSLFGWLVGTLASKLSVVLLLLALASLTFLAATGIEAVRRLPALAPPSDPPSRGPRGSRPSFDAAPLVDRPTRFVGVAVALGALLVAVLGLRVGAGESELLPTVALGVAGATALGASAACVFSLVGRGLAALQAGRAQRTAALQRADVERHHALDAQRRAYFEGADLRAEVAGAEASIARLREALGALLDARDGLQDKLDQLATEAALVPDEGEGEAPAGGEGEDAGAKKKAAAPEAAAAETAALLEEVSRARDEVTLKIELGERVLAAAEGAAFRLACNAPLRRLVRRRPREAMQALAAGAAGASSDAVIAAAVGALEAFLCEVRAARVELDALDAARTTLPAPDDDDPLDVARRELDALDAAYGALLQRLHVARLRLSSQAGMAAVATAAGAISGAARAAALDPAELSALVTEVARADAAVAMAAPDTGAPRGITEALAAGSAALDRSDAASLWDLITALREVR